MANRLQSAVSKFISDTQTGFIKGKLLGENLAKIWSLIDYCEENAHSGLILSFDFEKAFDKVIWTAIFKVFERFNFGQYFVNMIQTMYTNPLSAVLNSGYWGEWFSLERSMRQGSPASSLIFATIIELLGIKIKANPNIQGIDSNIFQYNFMQYADDIWVALEPSADNINNLLVEMECFCEFSGLSSNNLLVEMECFCEFSGLSSNYEKSAILRESDAKYYTIKPLAWADQGFIKILGINVTADPNHLQDLNYGPRIEKVQGIISRWKNRNPTLMGRIALVNSLIILQLMFLFLVLPSPEDFHMNLFLQIIKDFLWKGKRPRIKHTKLVREYNQGGLKLADLRTKDIAMKVKWVEYL